MLTLLNAVHTALSELLPDRTISVLIYGDFQAENFPAGSILILPLESTWNRTSRGGHYREYGVGIVLLSQIETDVVFDAVDRLQNLIASKLLCNENEMLDDYSCQKIEQVDPVQWNPSSALNWTPALKATFWK